MLYDNMPESGSVMPYIGKNETFLIQHETSTLNSTKIWQDV